MIISLVARDLAVNLKEPYPLAKLAILPRGYFETRFTPDLFTNLIER